MYVRNYIPPPYDLLWPYMHNMHTQLYLIREVYTFTNSNYFCLAFRMAKVEKHCSVDAVLSDLQKTEVSVGTASRTPRYVHLRKTVLYFRIILMVINFADELHTRITRT